MGLEMPPTSESLENRQLDPLRRRGRNGPIACGLLLGFLLLYLANGDFLPASDPIPNVYLPVNVLNGGGLTFTPDEMPFMFLWTLEHEGGRSLLKFNDWDATPSEQATLRVRGPATALPQRRTWRQLHDEGKLTLAGNDYFVWPAAGSGNREFIGGYGVGAGLTALPCFALQSLLVDDFAHNKAAIWHGAKFVASLCVALSVAMVFLSAGRFVGRTEAAAIALAYGAGTCVWSMASQTLWQHGPTLMFLSLGIYCLLRAERSVCWAAACGATLAASVVCRRTMAVVVLTVGIYLIVAAVRRYRDRSGPVSLRAAAAPVLAYLLAGLPLAVLLGYYNWHYLGSPWASAQMQIAERFTEAGGGPWGTPLLRGAAAILLSPSRGLLVYSPILLFSFWGLARAWREPRMGPLRPLGAAVMLIVLIQSKWYASSGGHCFGYRLLVDVVPLLAVCSVAIVPAVCRRKTLLGLAAVALVWSVGVQVLGAFAYNTIGWNCRKAYAVTVPGSEKPLLVVDADTAAQYAEREKARVRPICMNIDTRPFHYRLWSIRDSQIVYYAAHFRQSRALKKDLIERWLDLHVTRFPPDPLPRAR